MLALAASAPRRSAQRPLHFAARSHIERAPTTSQQPRSNCSWFPSNPWSSPRRPPCRRRPKRSRPRTPPSEARAGSITVAARSLTAGRGAEAVRGYRARRTMGGSAVAEHGGAPAHLRCLHGFPAPSPLVILPSSCPCFSPSSAVSASSPSQYQINFYCCCCCFCRCIFLLLEYSVCLPDQIYHYIQCVSFKGNLPFTNCPKLPCFQ